MSKELYDDWFSDNIDELRKDFCEEESERFDKFCGERFDVWKEER